MNNHNDTPNKFYSHQHHKHTKILPREQQAYNGLNQGKRSATQITIALGFCDPSSNIRNIRNNGISVFDESIKKDDNIYKQYWIEHKKIK